MRKGAKVRASQTVGLRAGPCPGMPRDLTAHKQIARTEPCTPHASPPSLSCLAPAQLPFFLWQLAVLIVWAVTISLVEDVKGPIVSLALSMRVLYRFSHVRATAVTLIVQVCAHVHQPSRRACTWQHGSCPQPRACVAPVRGGAGALCPGLGSACEAVRDGAGRGCACEVVKGRVPKAVPEVVWGPGLSATRMSI